MIRHCFGAIPATAFTCNNPERVKGLLLTPPAIHTKTTIPFFEKFKILIHQFGHRNFKIDVHLDPEWFSELPAYTVFIEEDDLSLKEATGELYYQIYRARQFIHRNIKGVNMPVFMGIAKIDPICDNSGNMRFFNELSTRNKIVFQYEKAGHVLEFSSEREVFFKDIAGWLNRYEEE